MTLSTEAATVVRDTESFFNSSAFHNHIRTWTFVVLALFVMGFLYVHESNSRAANVAVAAQIEQQGKEQRADLTNQITAIQADTKNQVQALQQQMQQVQTVSQAIASIQKNAPANQPPIVINPIVQPAQAATATTPAMPAKTTADDKLGATGDTPVATLTGDGLKQLADNANVCKQQSIELNSCKVQLDDQKKISTSLQTENTKLTKLKIEPTWKKVLGRARDIAIGYLIGHEVGKVLP
jgi:hypothetical protein